MSRKLARRPGRRGGNVPMSLRLPPQLRARVKRYATRKGLEEATAIRVLCAERLEELELTDELRLAEQWQRQEALVAWDQLLRGELEIAPANALKQVFAEARARMRRRK